MGQHFKQRLGSERRKSRRYFLGKALTPICKVDLLFSCEKPSKPTLQGGIYCTALQAASSAGHLETMKLLLDNGADLAIQGVSRGAHLSVTKVLPLGGKYGTALQAASQSRKFVAVELLLNSGADPNLQGKNNLCPGLFQIFL
jgi:hypothetical protein